MKKVFVVCPTDRSRRELEHVTQDVPYELSYDSFDAGLYDHLLLRSIEEHTVPSFADAHTQTLRHLQEHPVDGVTCANDYPGSIRSGLLAHHLQLPGPSLASLLQFHHKYHSRQLQQEHVGHAVPRFELLDPYATDHVITLEYPVFVKPVKCKLSLYASMVRSPEELQQVVKQMQLPLKYFEPFEHAQEHIDFMHEPVHGVLVEEHIEGIQVTLEGFVFNGQVTVMGIVDSIMVPGTISFDRFEYPSALPAYVQKKMETIARTVIIASGFNNSLFNIEFFYNPDTDAVTIIEINPRMSSQFGDLYERVDGTNSYRVMLDIATGVHPLFVRGAGQFSCAAVFILRSPVDRYVVAVPTAHDLAVLQQEFPDVRTEIWADPGKRLSEYLQDVDTFRYGSISLGAQSKQELEERFRVAKRLFPFVLR